MPERDYHKLSTGEAAMLCSVKPDTVLKWITKGRLRASRTVGGHYRIGRQDLEPFIRPQCPRGPPVSGEVTRPCPERSYCRREPGAPVRILVVTRDEALMERVRREAVESVNFDFAANGYEAAALMATVRPELIVLDRPVIESHEPALLDYLTGPGRDSGIRAVVALAAGHAVGGTAGAIALLLNVFAE